MDTLPIEIINEILLVIDRPSLFYTSQVCKQWRSLSSKQIKIIKTLDDFVNNCKLGDKLSIVNSNINSGWLNEGLYSCCQGGHKELAELMITKGAYHYNIGLWDACEAGHKELAELMITKGADYHNIGIFGMLVKPDIKNLQN